MHVILPTIGSAGDVHPVIAVGRVLLRRGHHVTVITNPWFEKRIRDEGLGFVPLGTIDDYHRSTEDPDLWHPRRGFDLVMRSGARPSMRPVYEFIAAHDAASTVVAASPLCFGARLAQERLGYRVATLFLQPVVLRSVFTPPATPNGEIPEWFPRPLLRGLFRLMDALWLDRAINPWLNAFRTEIGLPPVSRILDGWWISPAKAIGLFPDWFAPPPADWPPHVALTGFVEYDGPAGEAKSPAEIGTFLAAGDPPILVTPGSAMLFAHKFLEAAAGAAARLGRRALFVTGNADQLPDAMPPGSMHLTWAPFGKLLPRCAAIVHHGGIGTVAQALAAGLPQLIVPSGHDQPDNLARLRRLGVADGIPPKWCDAAAMTARLGRLLDSSAIAARCRELAPRVDFAAAAARAAELIEAI